VNGAQTRKEKLWNSGQCWQVLRFSFAKLVSSHNWVVNLPDESGALGLSAEPIVQLHSRTAPCQWESE